MLGGVCYGPDSSPEPANAPYGLVGSPGRLARRPFDDAEIKIGAAGPDFVVRPDYGYGLRMRNSNDLPIACVRFTTFSLRRIFCTWFFTVSGLILRMAPISKFDLPR